MSTTCGPNFDRIESPEFDDWDCEGEGLSDDDSQDPPSTASTPDFSICDREAATSYREIHQDLHYEEPDTQSKIPTHRRTASNIVSVEDIELSDYHKGFLVRNGKRYDVSLSLYSISWSRRRKCGAMKHYEVSLVDVLGACSQLNYCIRHMFAKCSDLFKLRIYTYKKLLSGKWKNCYYQFYCETLRSAQDWAKAINLRLTLLNRPRRMHVFVNPYSGEGKGCQIYNTKVAPIFQLAGITTTVTVTERAGHAKDCVSVLDLSSTDAIICVGGDGLFHEVFNSLFWKQQRENFGREAGKHDPVRCPTRIGVIPGGSTNGVVLCTTGIIDATTSALQIAMGRELNADLISCWNRGVIDRFAMNYVGYGFLGDVLRDSERYRWMGPSRYDFSGAKTMLTLGSYKGKIMFKEGYTSGTPADKNICRKGCLVCKEMIDQGSQEWRVIDSEFASIDGCIMSCCCAQSPKGLSPAAHLGDGCLDLIIHKQASWPRYLRYMLNTAVFRKPFTGDLVDVYRVTEFKYIAQCENHWDNHSETCNTCSTWNVDGEIYREKELHVKVHRQLITLMASQRT